MLSPCGQNGNRPKRIRALNRGEATRGGGGQLSFLTPRQGGMNDLESVETKYGARSRAYMQDYTRPPLLKQGICRLKRAEASLCGRSGFARPARSCRRCRQGGL
jgi:hypothetical protein